MTTNTNTKLSTIVFNKLDLSHNQLTVINKLQPIRQYECAELEKFLDSLPARDGQTSQIQTDSKSKQTSEAIISKPSTDNYTLPRSEDCPQPIEWCDIKPLDNEKPPNPYPIDAWVGLLRDVIIAIAYIAQVSLTMAAQCVLGALSTMGQRYINAPDLNCFIPVSIYLLTLAESGDGKSQSNGLSHKAINDWEEANYKKYLESMADWEKDRDSQKTEKEKNIYLATVPQPVNDTIMLSDATIESIVEMFIIDGLTDLSWTTDEAGQFLGGHSMKSENVKYTIGTLTKLYDGSPIKRKRSRSGKGASPKTHAYDVRLTLDLQGQPAVLTETLNDPLLRGQGFLARFMIASPESMQGKRDWNSPERLNSSPDNDPRLLAFWQKCKEVLDPSPHNIDVDLKTGKPIRYNMPFADYEAKKALADYRQEIEGKLNKGQELSNLRPFANRLAQNASKIAALMAWFEGKREVSASDIKRASKLTDFSISEHLRYLQAPTPEITHANQLLEWLISTCKKKETNTLAYSDVQSKVTISELRGKSNKENLELAIQVLHDNGYVQILKHENQKRGRTYISRTIEIRSSLLAAI